MRLIQPRTVEFWARFGALVFRCWMRTCKYRFYFDDPAADPREQLKPGIYLMWHEMMLLPAQLGRQIPFSVLVSRHQDGELISRVLNLLGFATVRGSTNRQGFSALRELMRQGKVTHLAITPDGPRGPRRVLQPGCIFLASRTGMPIIPIGLAFRDCWRAKSWDSMAVPVPGTECRAIVGHPINIPPDISGDEIERHRQLVQAEFDQVQSRAEAIAARQYDSKPKTRLDASASYSAVTDMKS